MVTVRNGRLFNDDFPLLFTVKYDGDCNVYLIVLGHIFRQKEFPSGFPTIVSAMKYLEAHPELLKRYAGGVSRVDS